MLPNELTQVVTLSTNIRDMPVSNLDQDADWLRLSSFSSVPPDKFRDSVVHRPKLIPSTYFISYLIIRF
jgi:hypothetical protein